MKLLIGDRLRELREDMNLTQKEVAQKIHCTLTMISNYELNRREPDLSTLKNLCSFYNVTSDYLLGLSSEPRNYTQTAFTLKEKQLYKYFNKLPDDLQDDVIRFARLNLVDFENTSSKKAK